MNKKITLQLFIFFFCFANANAQNLLKICIKTELDEQLEDVEFVITGNADVNQINNAAGCYQFAIGNTAGTFSITPSKNINHLNGVDVADIIAQRNYVLGMEPLSEFQLVACDLNSSGALGSNNSIAGGVTTYDMVLLNKSILRESSDPISNLPSWIFFDLLANNSGNFVTIVNNVQFEAPLNNDIKVELLAAKTGDGNISADPVMFNPEPVYDLSEKLTFRTPDLFHNEDDLFNVVFTAENFNSILGYQHTIKFDENKMEFISISSESNSPSSHQFDNIDFVDDGIVNTVWGSYDLNPISADMDEVIFTMSFRAKEDLQISDVITFNSASTLDIAYNSNLESMEVILLFEEPTSNENLLANKVKFENHPNPFQASTQINFTLSTNEYVRLEVTDALGQVIETLSDGNQTAGEHQILYTPKHLAKGIYFSHLTIGKNTLVQKIIKM